MSKIREVRMPRYPECWESCGACGSGDVFILEIFAIPGQHIDADENILSLETGKVALDIPSPHSGKVIEIHVEIGDQVPEGAVLFTLEED